LHGRLYPLPISEPKPLSFELILENTVLFDEIVNDRLLMAVKPTGLGIHQQMEISYDMDHCTNRSSAILPDNNAIRLV